MENFKNNLQILENTPVEDRVSDILSPRKPVEEDPFKTDDSRLDRPLIDSKRLAVPIKFVEKVSNGF